MYITPFKRGAFIYVRQLSMTKTNDVLIHMDTLKDIKLV